MWCCRLWLCDWSCYQEVSGETGGNSSESERGVTLRWQSHNKWMYIHDRDVFITLSATQVHARYVLRSLWSCLVNGNPSSTTTSPQPQCCTPSSLVASKLQCYPVHWRLVRRGRRRSSDYLIRLPTSPRFNWLHQEKFNICGSISLPTKSWSRVPWNTRRYKGSLLIAIGSKDELCGCFYHEGV